MIAFVVVTMISAGAGAVAVFLALDALSHINQAIHRLADEVERLRKERRE